MSTDSPCTRCVVRCDITQPYGKEHSVDGVFIKEMHIPDVGSMIPQHAHTYDHISYLARGRVKAWANGVLLGQFRAPHAITIKANVKHTFQSLEPNRLILCIHNEHGSQGASVAETHEFAVTERQKAVQTYWSVMGKRPASKDKSEFEVTS